MIAMRSPILIASSMSWVTNTTVLRSSRCRRRNSFCSRSRLIGSIAPNGSSMSISGGASPPGPAPPPRRPPPPADLRREPYPPPPPALPLTAGDLARIPIRHRRLQADEVEQLERPLPDALLVPAEEPRDRPDVVGDALVGEQADLLDRVADLAPQLGRIALAHAAPV